ncbi:MAG TPA: DUF1150 family protein [Azospirillaceae bacterium]|nr:DUF1150 family protein [Azospirillaceae bacterium]
MNPTALTLRQLSPQAFAAYGVDVMAYIKPVQVDGQTGYSIHAADGTPLTVLADRAVADATIRQHDLEPVSVH